MKPIGGYFGLECGHEPLFYSDGIYFNSCRNALRFLIRQLGITRIHIPVFTCSVVEEALQKENCRILKYNIDKNFFPVQDIPSSDFLVYNNYFGVTGEKVREMSLHFPNLIVDNAQSFFSDNFGRASVYSLRKFFGVPDGGLLRGKDLPSASLEKGCSYEASSHLLIRSDLGAKAGYSSFIKDEEIIDSYPVRGLSNLTRALLGNINYMEVKKKRDENYNYLKDRLHSEFPFAKTVQDAPLVYPFLISEGAEIRNRLISQDVFCARYWPNVLTDASASEFEKNLAKNIVSIPIDQRYGRQEMDYIINLIK